MVISPGNEGQIVAKLKSRIGNERGAVLFLVAASMVAMLGFASLAIDVGNMMLIGFEL
jgi:hypothetical protein